MKIRVVRSVNRYNEKSVSVQVDDHGEVKIEEDMSAKILEELGLNELAVTLDHGKFWGASTQEGTDYDALDWSSASTIAQGIADRVKQLNAMLDRRVTKEIAEVTI